MRNKTNQSSRFCFLFLLSDRTFAFSLVLRSQVRVSLALGPKEYTLVLVRFPIGATHAPFKGDIGAVWSAHAARLIPLVHFAPLSRTTVHIFTSLCRINKEGYE